MSFFVPSLIAVRDTDPTRILIHDEANHKPRDEGQNHDDEHQTYWMGKQASARLQCSHDRPAGNDARGYCQQDGTKHDEGADDIRLVRVRIV